MPKKNLSKLATTIAGHEETLNTLKDLPTKFNQLIEALSNQDGAAVPKFAGPDHQEQVEDEDIVSDLIKKSTSGMYNYFFEIMKNNIL